MTGDDTRNEAIEMPGRMPGGMFIAGLAKGLAVIEAFDDEHETMTIADVARRTGQSRAAARRVLHTLVSLGYARQDGRQFSLAPRVLKLGHAFLTSTPLPQLVQPFLEELSAGLNESCSAAIFDGEEVVYIARSATRRIMSAGVTVGTRFPAYASSMGRVLLAGLPRHSMIAYLAKVPRVRLTPYTMTDLDQLAAEVDQVRADGFSIVENELEVGLASVAVPVLDRIGRTLAAINVGTQTRRVSGSTLREHYVPALKAVQSALRELVR